MIAGYIYSEANLDMETRIRAVWPATGRKVKVWDNGYIFFDGSLGESETFYMEDGLIVLT